MKFIGLLVVIILIFYHTILANDWEDTKALRYFDCDDDGDDDCCDDYNESGNEDRIEHLTGEDSGDADEGRRYFFNKENCRTKYQNKDDITVRQPLQSFLNSLLETSFKPNAFQINKIITDVEKNSGANLSDIDVHDISPLFNYLITANDKAFDILRHNIFDYIKMQVPDVNTASEVFFGYLNNLKWSIHDLNDSIARNSYSSLTSSSVRSIEDAALIVAFALTDFLSSALILLEDVSTEGLIIEFFGVLQLSLDAVDMCDVAVNILLGHHSTITANARSLIFEVTTSLLNNATDLSDIFSSDTSEASSSTFNSKFRDSTSLYSSKYRNFLNSIKHLFEIVKSSKDTFSRQLNLLLNQFSTVSVENASSVFKFIPFYMEGIFGTLDFMLSTLSSRAPHELLPETNALIAVNRDFQSQFKLYLKAITPPISQSALQNIMMVAVQLFYLSETFLTASYKFIVSATGYMSQVVTELMATAVLLTELYSEFYYKININVNNLMKLFTGNTIPFIDALYIIEDGSSFYSAVGKIVTLTPALYDATTSTSPTALQHMPIALDNAFKLIIKTYTGATELVVIPEIDIQTITSVTDILKTINFDTKQMVSTIISLRPLTDNVATQTINRSARKLATVTHKLTAAILQIAQHAYNNIQTLSQTTLTGIFRELISSVLQIVYYAVFSVRHYLSTIIPGTSTISLLSSIEKGFVDSLSQSTVQLRDFNKFLDNDVSGFKELISYVTASIDKTVTSLAASLNEIAEPTTSPKQLPTELIHKLTIVIASIQVNINNGNSKDISVCLRNLVESTSSSFESISNAVQQVIAMFPNEWGRYTKVLKSSLPNVQIQTHAFIQNVQNLIGKSENVPIRDVRASAIRAVSAVSDFGKAISELVNAAANELSYENVVLLVALQKILAINSETTSHVVSAISNLLDVLASTKDNPLGDLSNILNNVTSYTDTFTDGFSLSADANLSNVYNKIKTTLNTCNSQLSNGIATITITIN